MIQIKHQSFTAEINPVGAELVALKHGKCNYLWEVNEQFWNRTSPILFPIVGRLKNDSYTYNNKSYTLPRHGFARNLTFKVVEKLEDSVVFEIENNEKTIENYPFDFKLQLKYSISNKGLKIEYIVTNTGLKTLLYSLGAHPAFAIDGNIEDYALQFDVDVENEIVNHQLENENFSGKTEVIALQNGVLPLNYNWFKTDAIVLKNSGSKKIELLKNNKRVVEVTYANFPYLGIWTKNNAPFICIEPWQGVADDANTSGKIEEKEGILHLESNKSNLSCIEINW